MKRATILISIIMLVLVGTSPAVALAGDWHTSKLDVLTSGNVPVLAEDGFWNYDFCSDTYVGSDNVDFPMTVLYGYNAWKSKVKQYYWGDASSHMTRWQKLTDYPPPNPYQWNGDKGTRSDSGTHMRIYAANNDFMYNNWLGKYVVCSTHYDREWTWGFPLFMKYKKVGWSEDCETEVCNIAAGKPGWLVTRNLLNFYNYEAYRVETITYYDLPYYVTESHIWQNSGYASEVYVP